MKRVSKRLHRVTQWMSSSISVAGSAVELLPGQTQGLLDLAGDREVPGGQVRLRDAAGVEHGPLLGQVLAGRKPGRVVAGLLDLALCSGAEHGAYTNYGGTEGSEPTTGLRAGSGPGRRGLPAADGLERRHRGPLPGAAPHAEGARDRAARRRPPRARGLSAPDRARSRRDGDRSTSPAPGSQRKSSIEPEEHESVIVMGSDSFEWGTGIPNHDYGSPPSRCSMARSHRTLNGRRARADADRGRYCSLGQGDRRSGPPRRGGPHRARRLVHEGLLPGPGADRAPAPPRQGERGLRVLRSRASA